MGDYDDIIDLPHHRSEKHPHMSRAERAAQFSPFAALTGYEDVLEETARLTDRRLELSESDQAELDRRLTWLADHLAEKPPVTVTYFVPDAVKEGGSYRTFTGTVRRIDPVDRVLILGDGQTIAIQNLASLDIAADGATSPERK